MIVISDTSPINYLILTDAIDILEKLFKRIVVPGAVFSELTPEDTAAGERLDRERPIMV